MTLLEVIANAAANRDPLSSQSEFPIILNPDDVFPSLTPKVENASAGSLANPLSGWETARTDAEVINSSKKFLTKLRRKLKDTNNFDKDDFIGTLKTFLKKVGEKAGISVGIDPSDDLYVRVLIEKTGFLMGRDLAALVLQGCVNLEAWELIETLIVNGLVDHSCHSNLVNCLLSKKRSDLLCLAVKHDLDLGSCELPSVLKFFLCPPKDAYSTMGKIREEWDKQALLSIEKVGNKNLPAKKSRIAKEASVLIMIGHDGFSVSELCLHSLLSSSIDDAVLSYAISKLSGKEMTKLIRYLVKWLRKYESFPQAGPCPKVASMFGLNLCDFVPKLEDVAKWLGLVIDENFSSLAVHSEFHEELNAAQELVSSLASESKLCCFTANIVERLRLETSQN